MSEKFQPFELDNLHEVSPDDQLADIVLVDMAPHVTVLSLCSQNGVKHVVQKSNISSQAEINFSSMALHNPSHFFQFPLSCIFGNPSPTVDDEVRTTGISFVVEKLEDRVHILSAIETFVKTLTSSPALLTDILTVIDETLTNAVYNAPYAATGEASRSREIVDLPIDPEKKPLIFVGSDSDRIVVGCRDGYGTLDVEYLIKRIKTCYESNSTDMINFGQGGAGIGSFMMFNSCASMYIGVDSGFSSTVCCSFPYKLSATLRSEMPKNIHLIHK